MKIMILLFVMLNVVAAFSRAISEQNNYQELVTNSNLHEYSFNDIGIFSNVLSWAGAGTFVLSINETFDFNNIGSAILVIDFTSEGDRPESPGYQVKGEFNLQPFEASITRAIIPIDNNEEIVQFAIPLSADGRIYSNHLALNISCTNEYSSSNSGILTIKETSRLFIGDVLLLENYGLFPTQVFPEKQIGTSSLSGLKLRSYLSMTIKNNSLLEHSECTLNLDILITGEVSVSLTFFDANSKAHPFEKNQTSENTIKAETHFIPVIGSNFYSIELVIYSDNLFGSDFNVTITNCNIELTETQHGFGFNDLEIPFFQWPSIPIVGVIVLFLWIMPYSILKYREWKKLPGEVDINIIDDEDINILDPEGMTAGDDDDDFEEAFDFEDD